MMRRSVAIAAFGMLAACATVTSSERDYGAVGSASRAETAYSLPRTMLAVTANLADRTITVTKGAEPDPRARFRLNYEASALSDDTITAEIESNGLLKSISSRAADKSADISLNIAKAVFAIGTKGAALPAGRALPESLPSGAGFTASYDPLDPDEVSRTRVALAAQGFCILAGRETKVGPTACSMPGYALVSKSGDVSFRDPAPRLSRRNGVFFRQEASQPVNIYRKDDKKVWQPIFVGNETFFDTSEVYEVAIDRAAFVEKKVDLTFTGGSLTKVVINKPSELLALSTAGLDIVQTVVAIPAAALGQDTALRRARVENLQARTDLIQRQDELLKLQVERQGGTQGSLVRSNIDFIDAGGRSLGAASGANAIDICQSSLGASASECRAFVERGSRGF